MTDVLTLSQSVSGSSNVRLFDLQGALPEILTDWLTQHQPHPVFNTPAWFCQLAQFEQARQTYHSAFYWLVLYDDSKPVLAAPIEQNRNKFGLIKLRLLSNFYSPMIDLFYNREHLSPATAWQLLVQAISQHFPHWLGLQITPLKQPQLGILQGVAAEQVSVFPYHYSANYYSQFGSADQYWQARSSKIKNTLTRKNKLLNKQTHTFELVTKPTDAQIAQYWQIYNHSWKIPEPSDSFINWLINTSAQQGQLRLGFLYIEHQLAACQLWLTDERTAYIFKLAQHQQMNQYSPGSLLTEYMINTLIVRDNITQIDFLLGDDNFKQLWMEHCQPIYGAELINQQHITGRLLNAIYLAKKWLKKQFRQQDKNLTPDPAANRSIS